MSRSAPLLRGGAAAFAAVAAGACAGALCLSLPPMPPAPRLWPTARPARPRLPAVAARGRAGDQDVAVSGARPSDYRRDIEWFLRGSTPRELLDGFPTGWRQLDELHRARPGEVTLIRPAAHDDKEPRSAAAARQIRLDRWAARWLAFEQASRLACNLPEWSFRLVFDSGTRERHFCGLQEFAADVSWIFEHFSIEVVPPGDRVSRCLAFETVSGMPRGVTVFRHGLPGAPRESGDDSNSVLRMARRTGVHVCVVEDAAHDPEVEDHLLRVCDNCLTVRAWHDEQSEAGVDPKVHSVEVRVDKARLRAPGGRHYGVLRPAEAPCLQPGNGEPGP